MLSIVKGPPFVQALWNVVDMKLMAFNPSIEDANWDHDPKHWQIKLAMNEKQRFKPATRCHGMEMRQRRPVKKNVHLLVHNHLILAHGPIPNICTFRKKRDPGFNDLFRHAMSQRTPNWCHPKSAAP